MNEEIDAIRQAALDYMEKATGETKANVIGYCLGGTLLGATLAYLNAKKQDRVACATCHTADYCSRCHNQLPATHVPIALFKNGAHARPADHVLDSSHIFGRSPVTPEINHVRSRHPAAS